MPPSRSPSCHLLCSSLFLYVTVLHDSHPRRVRAVQPGLPPASHNAPHNRAFKAREILLLPLVYRQGCRASRSLSIPQQVTQLGSSWPVLLIICAVLCLVAQLWLTLCDPVDCSLTGSCLWGFSRKDYWSVLPCPPPRGSCQLRDQNQVSHIAGRFFTI